MDPIIALLVQTLMPTVTAVFGAGAVVWKTQARILTKLDGMEGLTKIYHDYNEETHTRIEARIDRIENVQLDCPGRLTRP